MSCNESKTVLRAEFPKLRGKSRDEVYPFYKEMLGEAIELEEWEGKVEYFNYEGKYQPAHDYYSDRWGIDLVLHHESDYNTYIEMESNGLTLDEFNKLAHEMSLKFEVDKYRIRLISYMWYNGSDEPISFE